MLVLDIHIVTRDEGQELFGAPGQVFNLGVVSLQETFFSFGGKFLPFLSWYVMTDSGRDVVSQWPAKDYVGR